jgi:hypothetical protein
MGTALWLVSGAAAFALARVIPWGRAASWRAELVASLLAAFLLGAVATAADFGGWNEPDWRAALFALFGALAAAGIVRLR